MKSELPDNWKVARLEDLIDFVIGGDWGIDPDRGKGEEYIEVLCIRGSEIKNWNKDRGRTAAKRLVTQSSLEKRVLVEGDILVEISGGGPDQPVGRTIFIGREALDVNPELPKVCSNFLRLVRLTDSVDKKYVNHFLQYFYRTGEVVNYQGGSNNLRNLKFKEYSTIEVPIAPHAEQKRIVAKLDAAFAHLDTLKAKLEGIPELLKSLRQAVLTQAVTGKLTKEWREKHKWPEWQLKVLSEVSERITVGFVGKMSNEYRESGVPFLRSQNVRAFKYSPKNLLYISKEFHQKIMKSALRPGDVAIVRSGYPGTTCVIPNDLSEANCSDILILTPQKGVLNAHFVSIFMNSDFGKQIVFHGKVGNAQQHFNTKTLQGTEISLPSYAEQEFIVEKVQSLLEKIDAIEARYSSFEEFINKIPGTLLKKAFRGELLPQDDNDEPASMLLQKEVSPMKQKKEALSTRKTKTVQEKTSSMATLVEILRSAKTNMDAKSLWQASDFSKNIDAFYAALKVEVEERKTIKENTDKTLALVNEN